MTELPGLAQQQAERAEALQALSRLRREAREEISRLIQFLDASDSYVQSELEGDDDREPDGDDEPSLGSFDRMTNQTKSYLKVSPFAFIETDAEQDDSYN